MTSFVRHYSSPHRSSVNCAVAFLVPNVHLGALGGPDEPSPPRPPSSGIKSLTEPRAARAAWGSFLSKGTLALESKKQRYFRRLSRNTACSPNRFQNHHGTLRRIGAPQALSATAFSILAPATMHSSRKSLMLQKWMLGVSYQA